MYIDVFCGQIVGVGGRNCALLWWRDLSWECITYRLAENECWSNIMILTSPYLLQLQDILFTFGELSNKLKAKLQQSQMEIHSALRISRPMISQGILFWQYLRVAFVSFWFAQQDQFRYLTMTWTIFTNKKLGSKLLVGSCQSDS